MSGLDLQQHWLFSAAVQPFVVGQISFEISTVFIDGDVAADVCRGWALRMDQGTEYLSVHF